MLTANICNINKSITLKQLKNVSSLPGTSTANIAMYTRRSEILRYFPEYIAECQAAILNLHPPIHTDFVNIITKDGKLKKSINSNITLKYRTGWNHQPSGLSLSEPIPRLGKDCRHIFNVDQWLHNVRCMYSMTMLHQKFELKCFHLSFCCFSLVHFDSHLFPMYLL